MAGAGRAILVTTITTLAAFGVLSLSRFDALASLGRAVIVALGLAFFASVVLMPALLSRFVPGPDSPNAPPGE
jgi:predicted RND superfamily exporter protein